MSVVNGGSESEALLLPAHPAEIKPVGRLYRASRAAIAKAKQDADFAQLIAETFFKDTDKLKRPIPVSPEKLEAKRLKKEAAATANRERAEMRRARRTIPINFRPMSATSWRPD